MSEFEIDLTDGQEESTVIKVRLIDPATAQDGIDVWSVEHDGRLEYFETADSDTMLDVIEVAVNSLRSN